MSHFRIALLGLTALAAASPAVAGPISRTFNISATFADAPITDWTASFTVQFDPTIAPPAFGTATGLTINNISEPYDGTITFDYSTGGDEIVFSNGDTNSFGGSPTGSLNLHSNGFLVFVEAATSAAPFSYGLDFTNGDGNDYGASSVHVSFTDNAIGGAVPEPASWALMLGGFGLIGSAMRSRKHSVRFA